MKKIGLPIIVVFLGIFAFRTLDSVMLNLGNDWQTSTESTWLENLSIQKNAGGPELEPHPLSIQALRDGEYTASELIIEQTLSAGSNYQRFIASYRSEGLKVYGLLTVPNGNPSSEGWPAIIFNHGYIDPEVYRTTEKYIAYQDAFARNGYVTFKSDYRGHGNSEGEARGEYGSNDYTIVVLNATNSIRALPVVNPNKIGMWGHSMGGHITLESMVVDSNIQAGVIWAGVVLVLTKVFSQDGVSVMAMINPLPVRVPAVGGVTN